MAHLTGKQYVRYERNIGLPEIGEAGQAKLLASSVLIIGAGGLGTPAAAYLAAAGVGRLGLIDDDVVNKANLQRQFLYKDSDEHKPKVLCLAQALRDTNPDIQIDTLQTRLNAKNAQDVIGGYDLVLDGSDNFETKYLANRICYAQEKPLVYGAVLGFDGQVSVFKGYQRTLPCYQCLYANVPEHLVPSCTESAVLGPLVGVVGCWQAIEAIKELVGLASLAGSLLMYDSLNGYPVKTAIRKRKDCAVCGEKVK